MSDGRAMMPCDVARALLHGELSGSGAEGARGGDLEAHLAACEACRLFMARLSKGLEELDAVGIPALPAGFDERLRAGLEEILRVRKVQGGDRAATEELYLEYQPRVVRFCASILGSGDDGFDAAQEAFVRTLEKIQSIRDRAAFESYLFGIARKLCASRMREQGRVTVDSDHSAITQQTDDPDPDRSIEAQKAISRLVRLPDKYREAVYLVDVLDMNYEDAARRLGIGLGAMKTRVRRGRLLLQEGGQSRPQGGRS